MNEPQSVIYANNVRLCVSVFDVQLAFGLTAPTSTASETAHVLSTIIMSPAHAKAFSTLLADEIRRYEATYGPLPVGDISPSCPR